MEPLPPHYVVHPDVERAIELGLPVVALESAVITHGLPHPENLNLARELERIILEEGTTPATIAILNGKVHIGLSPDELQAVATAVNPRKISRRDYPLAIARQMTGGTTVAGTIIAAHRAGIAVFATGGIGGVHRGNRWDVSADLPELGKTPMVVICSGAKAILDLPATLEYLETNGVLVIGFQTNEFPAFYTKTSGLKLDTRVDTVEELAVLYQVQRSQGLQSALLVTQPPPMELDIAPITMEAFINTALEKTQSAGITGPAITPYMLEQVNILSGGASLRTNLGLLKQNAKLAARLAVAISSKKGFIPS